MINLYRLYNRKINARQFVMLSASLCHPGTHHWHQTVVVSSAGYMSMHDPVIETKLSVFLLMQGGFPMMIVPMMRSQHRTAIITVDMHKALQWPHTL